MENSTVQVLLKTPAVKQTVNHRLTNYSKQNDSTKIAMGEQALIRLTVAEAVVDHLGEHTLNQEEENAVLRSKCNNLTTENNEYAKRFGPVDSEYLRSLDVVPVSLGAREERKRQMLERIAQELLELQKV